MKILITENQLEYILLFETVDDEINKLNEWGYKTIDKFIFLNYTLILLYNEEEDFYEISLTSNDDDFTSYNNQVKKITHNNPDQIRKTFLVITSKIKTWIDKYGIMTIGSLNKDRTYKYHKLLSSFGFITSNVIHNDGDEFFPEFWDFTINR